MNQPAPATNPDYVPFPDRPPQERDTWVRDPELEGVVHMLASRTAGLPDANVSPDEPPRLIQHHGIGSNCAEAYVNEVFAIRDYCWCEGSLHPERVDWDTEDDSPYDEMPPSGGTSSGCPFNFEHYASGLKCEWYKGIGRDVLFNREPRKDEALAVLMDCLRSLPGMSHLPPVKDSHQETWGWAR